MIIIVINIMTMTISVLLVMTDDANKKGKI